MSENNSKRSAIRESELFKALKAERVERRLKNEAYSFIQSEKLTSKFLDYINGIGTTREQEAFYSSATKRDERGLWLESNKGT